MRRHQLSVCRARAGSRVPAPDFGIRVADSAVSKSLGKSNEITKAQHCRVEAFIENKGWLPVDPADIRKVVLEEELAVESEGFARTPVRQWKINWVGFNYARGFTLMGQKV